MAVAQALFVAAIVSAAHISGGHLNPAVTLGLLVGGHMTVVRSVLYMVCQLLASTLACFLVQYLTGGLVSQTQIISPHFFKGYIIAYLSVKELNESKYKT